MSISNMGSSGLQVHVLARDSETKRLLRNAMIGRSRLKIHDTDEYHLLESLSATARAEHIAQTVALVLDEVVTRMATIDLRAMTSATIERPLAPIYWWDSISNFGDVLGPWIVSKRFEVLPLNAWKTPRSGRPLATAGSIIPLIDRDNTYIWGSGMLSPLSATHVARLSLLRNTTVLATRGHRSAEQLSTKLNWQVPEVFGDPALLTSRYFAPDRLPEQHSKVALVCHWEHQKLVDHADQSVTAVNVKDGVESVVSTIANSKA
ncbi:hypothetical protein [Brevibacterium aurantiacum]|uniref:hypothetical protein n=1 Tax=Brevibacterium aurantiacum TaxID=273384 RepID=UPI001867781F|nr:hypothetical protein [Brevibacterium aurantiacum]